MLGFVDGLVLIGVGLFPYGRDLNCAYQMCLRDSVA